MGYPDQFAKQTFAEETEVLTGGAVVWQPMPEIGLIEVRGDGLLVVRDPARLGACWSNHSPVLLRVTTRRRADPASGGALGPGAG
jgi:hypothetical protein